MGSISTKDLSVTIGIGTWDLHSWNEQEALKTSYYLLRLYNNDRLPWNR